MKQFFKILFASALGFFLASVLSIIVLIAMISGIAMKNNKKFALEKNSVLELKLNGQIVDRSENNFYQNLFKSNDNASVIGLDDILESIRKAKENDEIKGILIDGDFLMVGVSSAQEIRNALLDFKKSGKFIIANSGLYTQSMYYIASVADKISLNPVGVINLRGLSVEPTFYKNTLDKLGIEMQVIKVGTYKSFAEQYTNTKMSDKNREQVSVFINSIWNNILNDISASRHIPKEKLNAYADEMMTFQMAKKAVAYKLVDTLLYKDEVKTLLASLVKVKEDDINLVSINNMKNVPNKKKEVAKEKIAIVYALGGIDNNGSFDDKGIKSSELVKTLQDIRKDSLIKAVVFRVNSPGGSAYGSEQIWREISLLKKKKPVIVSMGDYAASGGYYISCAADVIVAEPTTLTGSIGIFGIIPNVKGLTDKIGVGFDIVKTNKMSDMPSLHRALTEEEKNIMQLYINEGYELFVKRCADGRKKSIENIKAIAEGRVWTGEDAKKIGLVDELGDMKKAIEIAVKKSKLKEYKLEEYPKKKDFMSDLFENMGNDAETKFMKMQLGENYTHFMNLKRIDGIENIQAMLPFDIIVK